ncbi:MAG: acyl-CoA dehydrogenase family protein, partial [Candidatus Saccharibacteria bacterium]
GSDIDSITSLAVHQGSDYVITGVKDYILNASAAAFFSVFAATNPQKKRASLRAFIIPASTPGLRIGRTRNKVGIKYANTSEVLLEAAQVPETNMVGGDRAGTGYLLLAQTFDRGRALVSATAVGIARAAYEMALEFSRNHRQFGKPIFDHQAVSFTLAEMATKIELARLITWKACWLIDQDQDYTTASSMAKLYSSAVDQEVSQCAADILAGPGYLAGSYADMHLRDARVLSTIEGTNNIQKAIIASLL